MLVQKLKNRYNRHIVPRLRTLGIPGDANDWKLWSMKNRHRGRRAFIIGNGPSLRMEDLEMLARRKEISLASNKIFLAFESTAWRPSYYGIGDTDIAKTSHEEINKHITCPMVVANYLADILGRSENRIFIEGLPRVNPPEKPGFSFNLLKGVNRGGTITYVLLQIAAWLGIEEAYLLGVDCSYNLGELAPHKDYADHKSYTYQPDKQKNYFTKSYLKPGESIVAPDVDRSLCAYQSAFEKCHQKGMMRIYNATRGGKVEAFQRVNFDDLF